MCQVQGPRPLLDPRGLQAFRQHCITHQHDCINYITKWVQKYFQKPLLVNTIHLTICRCQLKLYHAERKPNLNLVQKNHHVLWTKTQIKWTVPEWESLLWSDESKFDNLVGNYRHCVLQAKEEGDLPACYQYSVQNPASLMVLRCISTYGRATCLFWKEL